MTHPATSGMARGFLRAALACVLALLAPHLSGCITADGVLQADGSAKLTLSYPAPPGASEASQRERLTAPGITVESLAIASDRTVTAKLLVTDLAAIGKTALLKDVIVTTATDGDAKRLTIAMTLKPSPHKPGDSLPGPSIRVTLPGTVLDATEQGVVDGASVQWAFRLRAWMARPERLLSVRYRPAPSPSPTPAPAPAAPGGTPGTAKPE
jgi:hypothetical protein